MKYVILLLLLISCKAVNAQSNTPQKLDTTLWVQGIVTDIKVCFVPGGRSWKVTIKSGEQTAIQYCNRYPRELKENDCIVLGKDIWNELLTNKH